MKTKPASKTATYTIAKSEVTGQYVATITYNQYGRTWTNSTAHAFQPSGAEFFARQQIKVSHAVCLTEVANATI